jgi:hypothetical protein
VLLVPNQRSDTQSQLQKLLPANAVLTPCNYLSSNVVRVEGFASAEIATAWAQYIAETIGLQAYVARPPASSSIGAVPTGRPNPTLTTPATPAYNPQPLGAGFAVVVNYFNQPELATNVRQVTSRDVGLVAVNQQPYLLADHTTDITTASNLLRSLTEHGLTAAIVDSRRAMLLTPAVKLGN